MADHPTRKRILLTAVGSLGDLHPYIAIALGLRERGHEALIATSNCYRQKIEALGLGFRTLRPDSNWVDDRNAMRRIMDLRWGTMRVLRDVLLPVLRESYQDILAAAEGVDLLVSHPLTYATRLVAEKKEIPWASSMTAPAGPFGLRPSLAPRHTRPLEDAPLSWAGVLVAVWADSQATHTPVGRLLVSPP
ncbi:MAG: glycosyltransferase [Fimbriimonadales bacterium]